MEKQQNKKNKKDGENVSGRRRGPKRSAVQNEEERNVAKENRKRWVGVTPQWLNQWSPQIKGQVGELRAEESILEAVARGATGKFLALTRKTHEELKRVASPSASAESSTTQANEVGQNDEVSDQDEEYVGDLIDNVPDVPQMENRNEDVEEFGNQNEEQDTERNGCRIEENIDYAPAKREPTPAQLEDEQAPAPVEAIVVAAYQPNAAYQVAKRENVSRSPSPEIIILPAPPARPQFYDIHGGRLVHPIGHPHDYRDWTASHVASWVNQFLKQDDNLYGTVETIKKNDIDGYILAQMAAFPDMLQALGLIPGHFFKMRMNAQALENERRNREYYEAVDKFHKQNAQRNQ